MSAPRAAQRQRQAATQVSECSSNSKRRDAGSWQIPSLPLRMTAFTRSRIARYEQRTFNPAFLHKPLAARRCRA